MPWEIRKSGSQFCIHKEGGGKVACHKTRAEAVQQMRALYANEKASCDSMRCPECSREFLSESAFSQHLGDRHPDSEEAREFKAAERKKAASSGAALKDGSFPIKTVADLRNAISAYGRASNKAAAKAHIIKRAKALGATNLLPDGWLNGDKAERAPMNRCEPCGRPFATDRALLQHATALHDLAEDLVTDAFKSEPWLSGERRLVVETDRDGNRRVIKDYETLVLGTADHQEERKVGPQSTQVDSAKVEHHVGPHGSNAVASLACDICQRGFFSVRALKDHASSVHPQDESKAETFSEKEEVVRKALRATFGEREYAWIVDISDDWVVYSKDGEEYHLRASYVIGADGTVTFGEPDKVLRKTVYEKVGE